MKSQTKKRFILKAKALTHTMVTLKKNRVLEVQILKLKSEVLLLDKQTRALAWSSK